MKRVQSVLGEGLNPLRQLHVETAEPALRLVELFLPDGQGILVLRLPLGVGERLVQVHERDALALAFPEVPANAALRCIVVDELEKGPWMLLRGGVGVPVCPVAALADLLTWWFLHIATSTSVWAGPLQATLADDL